ncbi:MAG: hypothetical protein LBS59_02805 [Puniceicoccales bacterium]|jgi:hypothetical protein|nr:hypothetical protein [Puniceicoccales bacterium]
MPKKFPVLPNILTTSGWKKAVGNNPLAADDLINEALKNLETAAKKADWKSLIPDEKADVDALTDFAKTFPRNAKTVCDSLSTLADKFLSALKAAKSTTAGAKEVPARKNAKQEALEYQRDIEDFKEAAEQELKDLLAAAGKNAKDDDEKDDDEDDDDTPGYKLKVWLKKTRKFKDKGLKFAFAKCTTGSNPKIKYQFFIDLKKLTKSKVLKKFGDEYDIQKVLAIGRVTFDGSTKTFIFAGKRTMNPAWEKIFKKVFSIQKVLMLGFPVIGILDKNDPEFNDPEDDAIDTEDVPPDAGGDSGDTGGGTSGESGTAKNDALEIAKKEARETALRKWTDAHKEVSKSLVSLVRAIAATGDPEAKEIYSYITEVLDITRKAPTDKASIKAMGAYLKTNGTIEALDTPNPFGVPVTIKSSLGTALVEIFKTL